ncbi:MAG TPA: TolC family protein [Gemmatimonadales bacterium]
MSVFPAARMAVVAIALVGAPSRAVTQPVPVPLRLGAVYRDLEARSPMLRAASASARAAAARVGPVSRLPDPSLQLSTMNRDLPGFELNEPLGMNQVQLMQMIPLGGRIGLATQAARARARAEEARIPEVVLTQRALAARQFYALYRIDRSVGVLKETRELIRKLERTAEAMYAVGSGRQPDILRAQVEIARMTEDILRMEAMRVAEAARLNGLLDRPPADSVTRPALPDLEVSLPTADSLIALALGTRPMLRAAGAQVAAALAEERRARREIWPDLTLGVIYGQRGMPDGGTERMVSLMVGATVPIWAGSRQKQMRLEALAMREMAEADLATLKAETRAAVLEILAELDRVTRLTALYRGTVLPQAGATVSSALAAYQVGSVDFMTVLDNQMTVNRYRLELIGLAAERGTMLAELEMITGRTWVDPDTMVSDEPGGGR